MAPREPSLTLGVEEEYLLVDRETGDLAVEPPKGFMEGCKAALGDQVTHEFLQAQVEIGTEVCKDVAAVRRELVRLRRTIASCAAGHGLALLAVSTHPWANWREQKPVDMDRYRILAEDFQSLARRLVICGMHVHAGIEDDDLRVDLMNQCVYFLPHLLALSSSSPFWEGQETGLKSFRPTIFGDMPRSGLPETFNSFAEWQDLLGTMARTGVCDDPTKIWWDIRPSAKHPTLEMRACDVCTRLDDALAVAALYQSILAFLFRLRSQNQSWRLYRRVLVEDNKWRAQRYGVEGRMADFGQQELKPFADLVEELVGLVRREAEGLGCLAELDRARDIVAGGTSADGQVRVYRGALADGADEAEARRAVVMWLIEESLADVPLA
ncbi:MAG: carboxylate-amine ligase [Geminicoccaceae bacterium]|nr:carboxylate-amine ligase [Geminicoccaceae bacterium]